MNDLEKEILALAEISKELEPNEKERKKLLGAVGEFSNTFLETLSNKKAYVAEKPNSELLKIGGESNSLQKILEIYAEEVSSKGILASSGGHLGYIPGGGIYSAALADYLVDITNEYAGISFASPGAVAMEQELLNWMKSVFGFPETAVGNLTSGGSIANMIALTAARDRHGIKGAAIEKSVVYMSPHLHHCNDKALRIIGLEDVIIRRLELDSNSKIIAENLSEKIQKDKKEGLNPFLVIASAGTTDTGAVDPLEEIGTIATDNKLWYHIDAAYGGFFILSEKVRHLFKGIELADSLAVDPHKALFLPFGLGAVLIKDKKAVFHSHHYSATYMQDALEDASVIDPADVSPELTKHFRSFRLWLPLRLHGIKPFVACLEEKLLLTQYFRNCLQECGFELGPEPDLSVSYFWYPLASNPNEENKFNKRLLQEIHRDGSVFLSSTVLNGRFVIRMAILSFRTKFDTINKAVEMLQKAKEKILQEGVR